MMADRIRPALAVSGAPVLYCRMDRSAVAAVASAAGPVAFAACWIGTGLSRAGYSPVGDAISRLAAAGTATQPVMTGGILALAGGLGAFAARVAPDAIGRKSAIAAGVSAAATIGVAALPLEVNSTIDVAHGVAAGTGYVALALVPALAAGGPLSRRTSIVAAVATAASLVATNVDPLSGLFQRAGLSIGHGWIVATSLVLLRRRGR